VIGWANVSARGGRVDAQRGYIDGKPPRDIAFRRALDDELQRLEAFLGLDDAA
jgi:hypothetical protein